MKKPKIATKKEQLSNKKIKNFKESKDKLSIGFLFSIILIPILAFSQSTNDDPTNTFLGTQSGYSNSSGNYNVFLGSTSGHNNTTGSRNVYLGSLSGYYSNGSGNIFLGTYAGLNENSSNKLYIDNSYTSSPLIWGDFYENKLKINGDLDVTGAFTINGSPINTGESSVWSSDSNSISYTGTVNMNYIKFSNSRSTMMEIKTPNSGYAAIRQYGRATENATIADKQIGQIHFFDDFFQANKGLKNSSGAINIKGSQGITLGKWNNPTVIVDQENKKVSIDKQLNIGTINRPGHLDVVGTANVTGVLTTEGITNALGGLTVEGITNTAGVFTAEGVGGLAGMYVIGNPLELIPGENGLEETVEAISDWNLGTYLIGKTNIGFPVQDIVDLVGNSLEDLPEAFGFESLEGMLDARNELIVHGQTKLRSTLTVNEFRNDFHAFQVNVGEIGRQVVVGHAAHAAKMVAHGNLVVSKTVIEELTDDVKETVKKSGNILKDGWHLLVDTVEGNDTTQDKESFGEDWTALKGEVKNDINDATHYAKESKVFEVNLRASEQIGKDDYHAAINMGNQENSHKAILNIHGRANIDGDLVAKRLAIFNQPDKFGDTKNGYPAWPDYVFEKNYSLKPLKEVELFINSNKHLPEVPSAKEIIEKGLDVYNMDVTLLKKVEELTLYTIEQEKQIKEQKEYIKAQEARLQKLEEIVLNKTK